MHLFNSKFIKIPEHVTELPASVTAPQGFIASGVAAGLKLSGKMDMGILLSTVSCVSAALYTPNAAAAAPIKFCREELSSTEIQGVVVNSGSANACTGDKGLDDARLMSKLAAEKTKIDADKMAVASTGVIGQPLPMDNVASGVGLSAAAVSPDGGADFAEAIRTTDKIDKDGAVQVALSGGEVTIGACAKGAGMIAPNLATMLTFITTDAGVQAGVLKEMLASAVHNSFNAITVDGDMSTNDFILLLANGESGISVEAGSRDQELFTEALASVCMGLALKMVADGEGATKLIELNVTGAANDEEAVRVAKNISDSMLVKTAFYGRDANWGRLMASAGAALAGEPQLVADIYYENLCLALAGTANPAPPADDALKRLMAEQEISVTINLHRGSAKNTMYFSDLTHDYVTLNAEYTT